MFRRQTIITLLILLLLLVGAGYMTYTVLQDNQRSQSEAAATLGRGESAAYVSLTGETVSLDAYEDKVRVVNSWASWSPFSAQELKELEQLAASYADRDVVVLAINRNEDPIRAQRFLDSLGTFEHVVFVLDADDSFYERMDGKAMPETLFYDTAGAIVHHARGPLGYEQMVTYVTAALSTSDN